MKRHYFFAKIMICCLISALRLTAQDKELDLLYEELINAQGKDFIEAANKIASATGDTTVFTQDMSKEKVQTIVLKDMIIFFSNKEQYVNVIRYAQKAISFFEETRDTLDIAGCRHTLAVAYQRIGEYEEAIENYYLCNDILETSGSDPSGLRRRYTLNNIAVIYQHNKNYDLAEKIYNQCLDMINDKNSVEQNMRDRSNYLNNLSEIYILQAEQLDEAAKRQKIHSAVQTAEEALELSRKYNDTPKKLINRLVTLSSAYIANSEFSRTKALVDEAQMLANEHDLQYMLSNIYATKARGEAKSGNRAQAEVNYDKAIANAERNNYNELLQTVANEAYLYLHDSNPAKALSYFEKSVALKDSIFNANTEEQLNEFQVKYETAEKEHQIKLQKAELQRKNIIQWVLLGGFIISLVVLAIVNRYRQLVRRRNRELREMNATKDKFFSIISHDLKNPAIAQRDALQMLVDNGDKLNADVLTKYYSELLKSADMQVELLYSLLDWARVQTGRMPYNPTTFDLAETIRTELSLMQVMIENKDLKITSDFTPGALAYGDRNMAATVIRNLLSNAIKFTNRGGEIKIGIDSINDCQFAVTVADNGMGMDEEHIANLFRIDRQLSSVEGTAGEKGSGLGLIVCRELVERNGGFISVESTPGIGTTFCFTMVK